MTSEKIHEFEVKFQRKQINKSKMKHFETKRKNLSKNYGEIDSAWIVWESSASVVNFRLENMILTMIKEKKQNLHEIRWSCRYIWNFVIFRYIFLYVAYNLPSLSLFFLCSKE